MKSVKLIKRITRRFFELRVYDLAAQMSYYFLLSLFPFLFVIYSILSYLPFKKENILNMIQPYAPEGTYRLIEQTLTTVLTYQSGKLFTFSLIIALWLSSLAFQSMKRVLNDAYSHGKSPNYFVSILQGLILTIGFMFAIAFSILLPILERTLQIFLEEHFILNEVPIIWTGVQYGLGSIFIFIFFIFLYYFAPNIHLKLGYVLPGAIFSTVSWQLVSFGFAIYVNHNNYAAIYGQLGGIVVLMLWFYLTAIVIILGGIINSNLYYVKEVREAQ